MKFDKKSKPAQHCNNADVRGLLYSAFRTLRPCTSKDTGIGKIVFDARNRVEFATARCAESRRIKYSAAVQALKTGRIERLMKDNEEREEFWERFARFAGV